MNINHYLYITFLLSLTACTAPIDIETDNSEPVIVINGILTDEYKQQEIHISRSAPYFDNQPNTAISGAIVTIESSEYGIYKLTENDSIPGLYQTKNFWTVTAGTTYSLHVQVDFDEDGVRENYDAETTVEAAIGLDSILVKPANIMGSNFYSVNLYALDSPAHDYYLYKFAVNDSLITNKLSQYYTVDDVVFNGQYVNGIVLEYFDSIENEGKYSEEDKKDLVFLKPGDQITLYMSNISKGYHDFINQCQKEMGGENPFFGGPASNMTTNISNGGVGYFSGYCISSSTAAVPYQ